MRSLWCCLNLPLSLFHPQVQLVDGGDEDEEGEDNRQGYSDIVAPEEVYHLDVIGIGEDVVDSVGQCVVHPVHHDAGDDAVRAVVHPSQEQSQAESMGHLRGVHVHEGEEERRDDNRYPVAVHALQQCPEDGPPKHQFLYQWREDADAEESPPAPHHLAKEVAVDIGQRYQFEKHLRGDDRSQCCHSRPQQHAAGACAQVVARNLTPLLPEEDDEGDDAVDGTAHDEHRGGNLQGAVGKALAYLVEIFSFCQQPSEDDGVVDHELYHHEHEEIQESVDDFILHDSKSFSNNSCAWRTSALICRASSPGEANCRSSRRRWAKVTTSRSP